MNLNCFELFYATSVNTAECSYTFISLFTSLSLCGLHLFLAVFMEELASLAHLALVSRCFKITLSVSPLGNNNAELIRLFTMKNKTFFNLLLWRYAPYCFHLVTLRYTLYSLHGLVRYM